MHILHPCMLRFMDDNLGMLMRRRHANNNKSYKMTKQQATTTTSQQTAMSKKWYALSFVLQFYNNAFSFDGGRHQWWIDDTFFLWIEHVIKRERGWIKRRTNRNNDYVNDIKKEIHTYMSGQMSNICIYVTFHCFRATLHYCWWRFCC